MFIWLYLLSSLRSPTFWLLMRVYIAVRDVDVEQKAMMEDIHRMVVALFSIQTDVVLPDALSTESERRAHHVDFEADVAASYGCVDLIGHPFQLRCVVSGQFHPQSLVCKGAHLMALTEKKAMPLIGLKKCDVWDKKNG